VLVGAVDVVDADGKSISKIKILKMNINTDININ